MQQAPEIKQDDLVHYGTFLSTADLPLNYKKWVNIASDMVMYSVKNNYDPSNSSHVLAVKKAICCQVSYWHESGTSPLNDSEMSSYSLGELSVSVDSQSSAASRGYSMLCPTAMMYLKDACLLFRGLRHGRW